MCMDHRRCDKQSVHGALFNRLLLRIRRGTSPGSRKTSSEKGSGKTEKIRQSLTDIYIYISIYIYINIRVHMEGVHIEGPYKGVKVELLIYKF